VVDFILAILAAFRVFFVGRLETSLEVLACASSWPSSNENGLAPL
jgi:hypothetical protein